MTDIDPEATITSIDGMSAFDLISRRAMLEEMSRSRSSAIRVDVLRDSIKLHVGGRNGHSASHRTRRGR